MNGIWFTLYLSAIGIACFLYAVAWLMVLVGFWNFPQPARLLCSFGAIAASIITWRFFGPSLLSMILALSAAGFVAPPLKSLERKA